MQRLSFRATTMLGFGAVVILFSFVIAFCIVELRQIQQGVAQMQQDILPYELLADEMALDVVQVQQYLTDVSATHDREGFDDAAKYAQAFKDGMRTLQKHYAQQPAKLTELERLETAFDQYYAVGKRMAEAYITGGMEAGNQIMKEPQTGFDAAAEALTEKVAVFRNAEVAAAVSKIAEVDASSRRSIALAIGIGLVGVVVSLGLAWLSSNNLLALIGADPQQAKAVATEISSGDLTRNIALKPGDNSSLMFEMRAMQMRLRDVINGVVGNAADIADTAKLLASSSQSVLAGSQRQNDAAMGVAAATEEMTANIRQIASDATHSGEIARQAGTISDQGGEVVSDAVEEMNKIAGSVSQSSNIIRELGVSSQKISEIVNLIKNIADQTNLLALNAAIEAARAGEQGRGFAVVADEVRSLAARTSSATQEISTMVENIQKSAVEASLSMEQGTDRVNEGVAKAERAGASMSQIKVGTEQVVETVAQMTGALNEQSSAVDSVAREVDMIALMVKENTQAVDGLAHTSESLNQKANSLHAAVGFFKV